MLGMIVIFLFGWLIYAADPKGLHFGLLQSDESAAS